MSTLAYGNRIGKTAPLWVGCTAVIFDAARHKILLTQRTDNGQWCLPGGRMDPGESAAEACVREIREETGLEINITRLIGIYTTPDRITVYADGNRAQFVSLTFEAEAVAGIPGLSDETLAIDYFSRAQIAAMDLMEHHLVRIEDAFAGQPAAFIR